MAYWMIRQRDTREFFVTDNKPQPRLFGSKEEALKSIAKYEVWWPGRHKDNLEPVEVIVLEAEGRDVHLPSPEGGGPF